MPASYGGSSGGSGPTTPALALLDAASPSTLVGLDGSGEGTALSYAAAATLLGVSAPTVLYASDFTVEPGGASGGNATKSGSGADSTITLTSATPNTAYGSGGATAPRAVVAIPALAREVEVTIQMTATTGTGDTNHFLAVGLRNAPNGGAPSALWGTGMSTVTSPNQYSGGMMSGAAGGNIFSGVVANTGLFAADRWLRATWQPRAPQYAILTGAGSAGAEPTLWHPPAGWSSPISDSLDLSVGSGGLGLAIYFQTLGGAVNLVATFKVTVRVLTW